MPNFGKQTDGAQETCSSADRKKVSSAAPTDTGLIDSITIRSRLSAAGTTNIKGVIYGSGGSFPSTLLATSAEGVVDYTTEAPITLNFTGANQFTVVSGTSYWIGFHQKDPGVPSHCISRDATAAESMTNTDTYADGPTDPFGSVTAEAGKIDCYVTFSVTTPGGDTYWAKFGPNKFNSPFLNILPLLLFTSLIYWRFS